MLTLALSVSLIVSLMGTTIYWRYGPPARARDRLEAQLSTYQELWDVTTEAERERIQETPAGSAERQQVAAEAPGQAEAQAAEQARVREAAVEQAAARAPGHSWQPRGRRARPRGRSWQPPAKPVGRSANESRRRSRPASAAAAETMILTWSGDREGA